MVATQGNQFVEGKKPDVKIMDCVPEAEKIMIEETH
jgi:hypothetical protein